MLTQRKFRTLATLVGGALVLAGTATPAAASTYRAVLSGDNILSQGDPDGWGRVRLRVDDTLNTVCGDVEIRSIGRVTAVQIHRGGEGADGPPVINLDRPDDEDSDDCDHVGDALADDIQRNPADFYVMVRTEDFPRGALRGQLGPGAD